jgi:pyruvate-ferredoxin/flavodoxin oxidoreductase
MSQRMAVLDGNEACARVAYALSEVCAIYPITPSSPMAELADQWSSERRPNIWGRVPEVIEMQSEGGAAGVVHGALQAGALTTTFTASQGLLLMIPNMYRIAGELTPAVFHVAARSLATHALSIFGDHQDVMAVRATGFAILASATVQEAHDLAAIATMATLGTRVPFVHFFDGFRTSHEVARIELLEADDLRALIDDDLVLAHRARALNPDAPVIRGTAQNPDVYFQAREASTPFHARVPAALAAAMGRFARRTGRRYRLFEYHGPADAERVIVIMGSGAATARETVDHLAAAGERVGVVQVRLFRPFDVDAFRAALPPTSRAIAVLDRTKEPGAVGEPLHVEVVAALGAAGGGVGPAPRVIGGRYGLSSKEFTPAMVRAVFDELARPHPKHRFTVGITDDVSHTSLEVDAAFSTEADDVYRAVFHGLGSDGTVGANRNTIRIIGAEPGRHVQGYFVYDSKKSGSRTVSHLRFGPRPIQSAYLIRDAHFVGIHQFGFLDRIDVLSVARTGATVLLNSPYGPDTVWARLPLEARSAVRAKGLRLFVIDADAVARESGLEGRTSTVLQTCFFVLSGVLPRERALDAIRAAIRETYERKGEEVVRRNLAVVDAAPDRLFAVEVPPDDPDGRRMLPIVPAAAPRFVKQVTAAMLAGRGDELPVSALPADGTFPTATARWEKRDIASFVPVWDPDVCVQCGNCALVCPHGVIRAKLFHADLLADAPDGFAAAPIEARGFPETRYTLQVYAEDCTGCALCVEACPVRHPERVARRAINMAPREDALIGRTRRDIAFFETIPWTDRSRVDFSTVRGTQFLEPLFEFPGACAGCGETPYLTLLSRLFGERMMVANATGCSSIYGGNLPTTPWSVTADGRGPAWSNSLFEDNAEFGLGMRLAADRLLEQARDDARALRALLGANAVDAVLVAAQRTESELRSQRARVVALKQRAASLLDAGDTAEADRAALRRFLSVADHLVRRSIWIVGGDGWAYDIGSAGLDHVLASGRDVNVLVLDTEVYSNTGGQASKATPMAAVAKFANAGKSTPKKDLALQAIAYGNVYVARVAFGANPQQTLLALREAEAYTGPSLILAYSHCIAHGINMQKALEQQERAVRSGYWPLLRHNPALANAGCNPFTLDAPRPTLRLRDYADHELRFRLLARTNPAGADALMRAAQEAVDRRWALYEDLAGLGGAGHGRTTGADAGVRAGADAAGDATS